MSGRVAAARRRVRARVRALRTEPLRGDPIVVYQMGKVGSLTVVHSLRAAQTSRSVVHVHLLNDLDALGAQARASYPNPRETLREIARGRKLRTQLLGREGRTTLITLVRDPVQRNVSAFFENLTGVVPDVYERHARGALTTADLRDAFLDRYNHEAPITWFQDQLEPVFGIDVFAVPFDTARGFTTYEGERARLLCLRVEDLATSGAHAIGAYLDLPDFRLLPANVGAEKRYGELYEEFQRDVTLPDDYLDRMYDSRFARHFYTDAAIETMRGRWSGARSR